MAGFFPYAIGGLGFLLLAGIECLSSALPLPRSLPFLSAASLSFLALSGSIISSLLPSSSSPTGSPLPLSSLPVASLFLLSSLSSLLPLPSPLLHFLSLSAFLQELLFFRLRAGKDPAGLENRYFDLLLLPILLCAAASLLAIARPRSPFPRLARAAGLALHGSWLLQMAFSLFTSSVARGCALRRRSAADFTVVCRGHDDIHRSNAIATLQFNCHLAGLLALAVGVYAIFAGGSGVRGGYRPIVQKELRGMERVEVSRFTLDEEEEEERDVGREENDAVAVAVNGFGGAH